MESEASDDPSPLRGRLALLRAGALLALVIVSCGSHAQKRPHDPIAKFQDWDFRVKPVSPADLKGLSLTSLQHLRGIVFGKHGRVFRDVEIQDYLDDQNWYDQDPKFTNSMLNGVERRTLDSIRGAEAALHDKVKPGDLRFWMSRPIPPSKLKGSSLLDLHIMAREVEAIHGKRFNDEPAIQTYFQERYWYQPAARYDPKSLGAVERKNLSLLLTEERKRRNAGIVPGDMLLFETRPLPPSMLRNVGLYDLRLLRNEIFARRGYVFQTPWLVEYFASQPWMESVHETGKVKLTKNDQRNLGVILKREDELHRALSQRKISRSELEDLFVEDLRKLRSEIYARHGKVFKSKWLQSYFASMPWYKPDRSYSDKRLSSIERQNLATIARMEKKADSAMSAAEG